MLDIFSIIFLFFGIIFGLVSSDGVKSTQNYDYCDPKLKLCNSAGDHVMCKYPISGLSDKCSPDVDEPLNALEKKRILFWHNKFRSIIAVKTDRNVNRKLPASSNMRQIYWDDELEKLAERWAHQCVSSTSSKVYDKCRNTRRFRVTQNVGTRRVNGTNIDKQAPQIVVTWFKESKDFLPAYVDEFPRIGEEIVPLRQFTNVISADTYAIGCARVIFQEDLPTSDKNSKKTNTWTIERLVCNYGPGGTTVGKPVYKRGASCESCPEGTECSKVFPGLCATKNSETSEGQQNVENQDNKESNVETNIKPRVTGEGVSKSKTVEDKQDQKLNPAADNNEGEEEVCEGDGCSTKAFNPNDISRVHEILKNPKTPTGGKYLIKNGIYLDGKCHCSEIQRSSGWVTQRSTECLLAASLLMSVSYF